MSRLVQPQQPVKTAGGNDASEYTERIIKYIPSEIIVGYLFVLGIVNSIDASNELLLAHIVTFVVFLGLIPIYYSFISKLGEPKVKHIIVSLIAFVIWTYNISQLPFILKVYKPWLAALLLVTFTITSGFIIPKPAEK